MEMNAAQNAWIRTCRFRSRILFVSAVSLIFTFFLTASGVSDHRLFADWDADLSAALHRHARENPAAVEFFKVITSFGDLRTVISGSVFMLVVLLVLRRWVLAGIWGVTTLGGFELVDILKSYYARPRPHFFDPIAMEVTPSFPSGHAADSAMFYGMLIYVLLRSTRKPGLFAIAPLLLLVTLIGFSRVYLGAHWLSDVVAGWMLGFGWVALGMAGAEAGRAS